MLLGHLVLPATALRSHRPCRSTAKAVVLSESRAGRTPDRQPALRIIHKNNIFKTWRALWKSRPVSPDRQRDGGFFGFI